MRATLRPCGSRSASFRSAPSRRSTSTGSEQLSLTPHGRARTSPCSPKGRRPGSPRTCGRRRSRWMAPLAEIFPKPRAITQLRSWREGSSRRPTGGPAPDGRVYNTTVGYDSQGSLTAAYRKIHLFDALGYRESQVVAPGGEPLVARLGGLTIGFLTCYDVRFPELARTLAARGADLLVIPAAWASGLFKEEHWSTLVRARAIENTVWVAASSQVPDPSEPATEAPTGIR